MLPRPPRPPRHLPVLRLLAVTGAALLLTACAAASGMAARPRSAELPDRLQAVVDEALASSRVPGAAVIVDVGSEPWVSLTGMGDVAESTPLALNDRFSYRGITNSFVVTAILKLAADGALGLDDPVATFVPEVPGGDGITLRHLAGMRSGLAAYVDAPAFQAAVEREPSRTFTDRELLAHAYAEPAHFAPGARYEYSETNPVLLGQVLLAVTGKDWASVVGTLISGPLGLTSLSYPGPTRIPEPAASGYLVGGGQPTKAPTPVATRFSAAGGLSGTLGDLDRWATALGAGELLTPEGHRARTDAVSAAADDPNGPDYDGYGLGLGEIDGWWGHTGYGVGYSSLVMFDPSGQRTITILLNGSPENRDLPAAMFREFRAILDGDAAGLEPGGSE